MPLIGSFRPVGRSTTKSRIAVVAETASRSGGNNRDAVRRAAAVPVASECLVDLVQQTQTSVHFMRAGHPAVRDIAEAETAVQIDERHRSAVPGPPRHASTA